jgi:hypothetical protein
MENCLATCEDEEKVEQLIKNKIFFLCSSRTGGGRKYIQQFNVEDDTLATCSEFETKLYALKHQEKHKQVTIMDWLKMKFIVLILPMIAVSRTLFYTVNEKVSFTVLKVCKKLNIIILCKLNNFNNE